jgi:hypothetical protein
MYTINVESKKRILQPKLIRMMIEKTLVLEFLFFEYTDRTLASLVGCESNDCSSTGGSAGETFFVEANNFMLCFNY